MVFATENDVLNGIGMLFMELLTNRAQIFADVRTYWSPEATKRVTGYDLEGKAKDNGGIIHLLNSVEAGRAGVEQVYYAAVLLSLALEFIAGGALGGLRGPEGTHIREYLRTVREQLHE